ncbi:MAG: hypothetical protein RBS13_01445 [Bacteroidales bacterium]|nr:hypothetical protein [Bacteroidales bacterium]
MALHGWKYIPKLISPYVGFRVVMEIIEKQRSKDGFFVLQGRGKGFLPAAC